MPKQDMMAPNAYTLLMNSKPNRDAAGVRDSDAHAYDNVLDAIDAETLERKQKSSRRPYPVVTPNGQIQEPSGSGHVGHDEAMTSGGARRSVDSDPYAASFLGGSRSAGGGTLENKPSTATGVSSDLAGSSINRDSEGLYGGSSDSSSPYKSSLGRGDSQVTGSHDSAADGFGAVNPAFRQSFRESENTDQINQAYRVDPDTGLREPTSTTGIFATRTSAESPSLQPDVTRNRVSKLRDSFNEKSKRQFQRGESVASGDYYPLMRSGGDEVSRKVSAETYLEQSVAPPSGDRQRESSASGASGMIPSEDRQPPKAFDAKAWDEFDKDMNRKVSRNTNLKTISESSRPPSLNPTTKNSIYIKRDSGKANGSDQKEVIRIDKSARDSYYRRESGSSPVSDDAYGYASLPDGVPAAPPPPPGKSAATSASPPPPPPPPGLINPTL